MAGLYVTILVTQMEGHGTIYKRHGADDDSPMSIYTEESSGRVGGMIYSEEVGWLALRRRDNEINSQLTNVLIVSFHGITGGGGPFAGSLAWLRFACHTVTAGTVWWLTRQRATRDRVQWHWLVTRLRFRLEPIRLELVQVRIRRWRRSTKPSVQWCTS